MENASTWNRQPTEKGRLIKCKSKLKSKLFGLDHYYIKVEDISGNNCLNFLQPF